LGTALIEEGVNLVSTHSLAVSASKGSVQSRGFAQVYSTYGSFVWRVVQRLGVPPADVEDVCQEVFLVTHQRLPSFEGRSSVRTWIYGIAVRCASEHRRRPYVKREIPVEHFDDVRRDDLANTPGDERELRARLDRLLDQLDAKKRAVFVLYELEELPMPEIANIVGCPLQTAYSRLHAARKIVIKAAEKLARRERVG
jgi:RNA polymerase sigma-70 factor (ECF subfamily)